VHVTDEELAYIAERWLAAQLARSPDDALLPASAPVDDLIARDAELSFRLVQHLVKAASSDVELANVAAGPLEDLLGKWCTIVLPQVELEARRDPKFRRCLSGVWTSGLPPDARAIIAKYTSTVPDPL
jgi:hypothetical protein